MSLPEQTLDRAGDEPAPASRRLRDCATARVVGCQVVVFVLAVAARLSVILRHGGLHGDFGYDSGVYFAGGDAFVHGRLPYRDFVLIHPPGLMLLLSPFALLTKVVSDESAFTATVLAFTVLGGVNAVLVLRVARRLGLPMGAASAAGLFYALWFGSIGSEYLIKLEPVGNLFLLLGLLAALRCRSGGPLRWPLAAGLAFGATLTIKIWWVVPFVLAVGWLAHRTRSAQHVRSFLAAALLVNVVVDGPFFVVSPHAMWTSIVEDQMARPAVSRSPIYRVVQLSSVPRLTGRLFGSTLLVAAVLVLLVTAWLAVRAWAVPAARAFVALMVVQGVVLIIAPSWFLYYSDFIAVAGALTVGAAAVARAPSGRRPSLLGRQVPLGWVAVALVTAVTGPALAIGHNTVRPFRGAAALTRATAHVRCVMSDSPMGQIELNALSRNLAAGCRNWVDVTGRTYGADRGPLPRVANRRWQRDLTNYLRSGGAVILVRAATGVSPATHQAIRRGGVLARAGDHTVYRAGSPRVR